MKTTAKELVKCCFDNLFPSSNCVFSDYFGDNYEEEKQIIILGIYQGLVKYKGVNESLLHKCFLANRLDELIHKKYKFHKLGYYKNLLNKILK